MLLSIVDPDNLFPYLGILGQLEQQLVINDRLVPILHSIAYQNVLYILDPLSFFAGQDQIQF